jgi:hypothetical protein
MKKHRISVILVGIILTLLIFGACSSKDKNIKDDGRATNNVESKQTDGLVVDTAEENNSDKNVKKVDFHLTISLYGYKEFFDYIPEFKLEIRDDKDELLGSTIGNSSNFNTEDMAYYLVFNIPEYKDGDKLRLVLDSADSSLKGIRYDLIESTNEGIITTKFLLERGNYVVLPIHKATVTDPKSTEENIIEVQTITGSELLPFTASLKTDPSKVGVFLEDSNGNKIKNQAVNITSMKTREVFSVTSDEYGIAWIDISKVSPMFIAELDSYEIYISNGANGSLVCKFPIESIGVELDSTLIYKGIVDNVPTEGSGF